MALLSEHNVYIRVENPRIHSGLSLSYFLVYYIERPSLPGVVDSSPSPMTEVRRNELHCQYDLNGLNVFEQCYNHAKLSLPPPITDC